MTLVIGAILLAVIGVAAWWWLWGRWEASTDDAYVRGYMARVDARSAGTVAAVLVEDTATVKAGEVLVQLDDTEPRLALARAEADLAATARATHALRRQVEQAGAEIQVREQEARRARGDLARREAAGTAIASEDLAHARDAALIADAALQAARSAQRAVAARAGRGPLANDPAVRAAAASVQQAWVQLERAAIRAPAAGHVAKRAVDVGAQVGPGTPLMTIIALDTVWVNANFKETQIADLRIGQPAVLTADAYGSEVRYQGRVAGFSAGTGSVFSLLPAENASGSWVKVVQRLPVRIALDAQELARHPLRLGLSMSVTVDTRDRSGAQLSPPAPAAAAQRSAQYQPSMDAIDARIAATIAAAAAP